ncbi:MAG: hypothetical protein ACYC6N_32430 [Pirellulaceae bacterium]
MGDDQIPLFCARCLKPLVAGRGEFYVVLIEGVADPTPPHFSEEDLRRDTRQEIRRLVEALADCSERELLDQVFRRTVLHLCNRCFSSWIENPAG